MNMPDYIDRYRVVDFLGHGGFADVYLAHDPKLKRQVAVKLLHQAAIDRSSPNASMKSARERFVQEVEMLVTLEFDGVVRLYDYGEFDQRPYLVMQYMAGGTLAQRLDAGILSLADTAVILNRLCASLAKVHQRGIIHRDLKPQNILFDADGSPYLGDFGIAQLAATNNPTATIGTPGYMAPEQFEERPLTIQTDIYQMGVILFQLMTGSLPFEATTHAALIHKILEQPPPAIKEYDAKLDARFDQLFQIALAKDAGSRYGTAVSLADHFSQIVQTPTPVQEPIPQVPLAEEALVSPPKTENKRSLNWVWGGLLLLLLLLFGLGLLWPQLSTLFTERDGMAALVPQAGEQQQGVMVILVTATAVATDESLTVSEQQQPEPTPSPIATEMPQIMPTESDTATPTLVVATATPEPMATAFVLGMNTANVLSRRLSGLIVVDGNLEDWAMPPVTSSEHIVYQHPDWDESDDLFVNWLLTWDASYLYLGVAVLDDTHVQTETGNRIFRGDSVSLQIDTDRDGDLSDFISPDDFQIDISPGDFETIPPSAVQYQGTDSRGLQEITTNILVGAQKADFGYLLEAAIPWSSLNMTPVDGQIIGLALNATDDDNPETDIQELFISNVAGRDYNNPSSWGTLTLRDSTAVSALPVPTMTLASSSASSLMVEDFEYEDASILDELYWVNSPGNEISLQLGSTPHLFSGQSSLRVEYDVRIETGDFVGIERNLTAPMDWSEYDTVCFWIENPSFSGFFIFQFKEKDSESWKYRVPVQAGMSGETCLSLSKENFELNSRGLNNILELEQVDNFAFYFGEGGSASGVIYIDALQLRGFHD